MSRRGEIIQWGNEESNRVIERYSTAREEILRQQRATLSSIPEAEAAYAQYDRVTAEVTSTFARLDEGRTQERTAAEEQAQRSQYESESAALQAWREATERAECDRQDAMSEADRTYDDAYKGAMKLVLGERDAALKRARAAQETAHRACQRACENKMEEARRTYQANIDNARETAIVVVQSARQLESEKHQEALATLEQDRAKAYSTFLAALAANPLAASIKEAFDTQLTEAQIRCDEEKRAVLDRMRRELDSLPTSEM